MEKHEPTTHFIALSSVLLGVAFVVMKLCGVIGWSWWLVTLPFWWCFAAAGLILVVLLAREAWLERKEEE